MTYPLRKDVFLDFLSPDNHGLYATRSNHSKGHSFVHQLEEALNVAVQLCGERCILPPFFILQSMDTRLALAAKKGYLEERLIQFPVRETSLEAFLDKKTSEYRHVRLSYSDLYAAEGRDFLRQWAPSFMHRNSRVGSGIAERWEVAPDASVLWTPIKKLLLSADIDALRLVPGRLKTDDESVTWAGMQRHIPTTARRAEFEINQALQHEYTRVYLDEYDATIISRLPPKTTDLLLPGADLSYDYVCWRGVLGTLGLPLVMLRLDASEVITLRDLVGLLEFRAAFQEVCTTIRSTTGVVRHFARVAHGVRRTGASLIQYLPTAETVLRSQGMLTPSQRDALNELLLVAGELAVQVPSFERIALSGSKTLPERKTMASVFIVHGHDHTIRDKIQLFLQSLGLKVVVMESESWSGKTVPEKFESAAHNCDYAIVIATPDDDLTDTSGKKRKRLRQNVILEIGYFWGALGRHGKFSILLKSTDDLELPSDLLGIGYLSVTDDLGETKLKLQQELKHAGIIV